MGNDVRIQDLSSIYEQGLKPFIENFLREKAEKGESLVYSLEGKIIELSAADVLWIYTKLSEGPEPWELNLLLETADRGADMVYNFANHEVSIPAASILQLLAKVRALNA